MIPKISDRARMAFLGLGATVAAFVLFRGSASYNDPPADPLDAAPRSSYLVATANLTELRRSPLYGLVFGSGATGSQEPSMRSRPLVDPRAIGLDKVIDACGFEPLERVDRLMLAVPEEGERGELGLAAHVLATPAELTTCAERLAAARGERIEPKTRGAFAVLEAPASSSAPSPKLAYGRKNLLVVGRGVWFDTLLLAAEGKEPRATTDSAHATLREALHEATQGHSPSLLVTALLPRTLRDKLKREMASDEREQSVMSGVLGISGVGLALFTGTNGSSVDIKAELACDTEDACRAVEQLLLEKRRAFSQELSIRMLGLGGLLDSITVQRGGLRIRVTAGAPADTLTSAIDRILRLSARPTPPSR
jgi:hypothetical protein